MTLHRVLRLYTTSEKFYVQPLGQYVSDGKILEIDRLTHELNLNNNEGQIPPRSADVKEIYGIVGILHLIAGAYLIVITKRKLMGLIQNEEIWQMKDVEFLPFPKGDMHLTETQIRENKLLLQMAQNVFHTDGFYFSYTLDLTHTMQRINAASKDFLNLPLYERADQRFIWNHHLLRLLMVQPELQNFTLPILHGFIAIKRLSIKQFQFEFALISRRSCYRAGTRYNIRGVDEEGEVANFVETEQVVFYNGQIFSFVQSRGSIPLFWSQYPTLKYKPSPWIYQEKNHNAAFRRHIDNQLVFYGKQTLVNLIDQKGKEKQLGEIFQKTCENTGYTDLQLQYIAFDFHKECSKMRWHRLQILMDLLMETLEQTGWFSVQSDGDISMYQNGIIRTNCMDCLDRTNVVQSMIARFILEKQFRTLGVMGESEKIVDFPSFDFDFKGIWADNADMCAMQYTGTGALKTDFTRTGKRSNYGLLQDGVNSMIRYYKNNFTDGFRQDGIDLVLGNYIVQTNEKNALFERNADWKQIVLPVTFLLGFSMLIISLLIPTADFKIQLMYVAFWGTCSLATLLFTIRNGTEFVDKPRLANKRLK